MYVYAYMVTSDPAIRYDDRILEPILGKTRISDRNRMEIPDQMRRKILGRLCSLFGSYLFINPFFTLQTIKSEINSNDIKVCCLPDSRQHRDT